MTSSDTTAPASTYMFDNDTTEAARQVQILADVLDDHTISVLESVEVPHDGRCLDLGAGAGTISTWMAGELVPAGHVDILDLNPRHIPTHDRTTVITGDVTTHEFTAAAYDLIHARLLLMHLADRDQVLARVAAALKPGGVLVVSDWETTHLDEMFVRGSAEVAAAFLAFQRALIGLGETGGMDSRWARRIPAAMTDAGLVGVTAQTFNRVWVGGSAGMLLHDCNSRQKQTELLAAGMTLEQLDTLRTAMTDPQVWAWHWPMHTAVGVRPAN
ncbi:methyltransferase domain-containing protein [Amorphoplanes nipponensis]|uniref:Methyltransferase n=1 Tax=Actinoplanes nipponensis TaxID=135950 RepID=A0A919JLS4_9ACTN|nr:class I SAM-dependent methyltransferase [Actinoplanes nipponensis]GIE51496.1 methyltransferase [Actinoplanes nipponensis]